jgi:phage terminase large subunit-like protein
LIDHYRRNVMQGFMFKGIPATGSKELRAAPFLAAAEGGNVRLLNGLWVYAVYKSGTP